MEDGSKEVKWAPRVRQIDVRRLYELEAQGRIDEELLDEVGIALYARCESFCISYDAYQGRVHCPRCDAIIEHQRRPDDSLDCACGWHTTWQAYFQTIRHQQLSGAEPVVDLFRAYQQRYAAAVNPGEKMLAIDALLHDFHLMLALPRWNFTEKWVKGRCVAVNLIEGNYHEVITFLDTLNYGTNSSPEMLAERHRWRLAVARTTRLYNDEKFRHFLSYEED
jgi:hypothetical protein